MFILQNVKKENVGRHTVIRFVVLSNIHRPQASRLCRPYVKGETSDVIDAASHLLHVLTRLQNFSFLPLLCTVWSVFILTHLNILVINLRRLSLLFLSLNSF